jgi:hypothetical protein
MGGGENQRIFFAKAVDLGIEGVSHEVEPGRAEDGVVPDLFRFCMIVEKEGQGLVVPFVLMEADRLSTSDSPVVFGPASAERSAWRW